GTRHTESVRHVSGRAWGRAAASLHRWADGRTRKSRRPPRGRSSPRAPDRTTSPARGARPARSRPRGPRRASACAPPDLWAPYRGCHPPTAAIRKPARRAHRAPRPSDRKRRRCRWPHPGGTATASGNGPRSTGTPDSYATAAYRDRHWEPPPCTPDDLLTHGDRRQQLAVMVIEHLVGDAQPPPGLFRFRAAALGQRAASH